MSGDHGQVRIELSPYDHGWPDAYAREAARIRESLGTRAVSIEHVGSTSVPGLVAKPVIDIQLAVLDSTREERYLPPLEALGYVLRVREPEWFEHRLLGSERPRVNLHVFSAGCEELARTTLFRDWLRESEQDRALYAATKQRLAKRPWENVQHYADAKTPVIAEILERARAARANVAAAPCAIEAFERDA